MMEFIQNNIELAIAVLVVVSVLATLFIVSLLKGKGININTDAAKRIIDGIDVLNSVIKYNDPTTKDKVVSMLEYAKTSVNYVEQVAKSYDNEYKKEIAINTTIDFLNQSNIEVTDEMYRLIEVAIDSAVRSLPKTNKDELEVKTVTRAELLSSENP